MMIDKEQFNTDISMYLTSIPDTIIATNTVKVSGKLSRMIGLTLEAEGCVAASTPAMSTGYFAVSTKIPGGENTVWYCVSIAPPSCN